MDIGSDQLGENSEKNHVMLDFHVAGLRGGMEQLGELI